MAQNHTWFATANDARAIVSWLREAGAVAYHDQLPEGDFLPDGREFVLHFPAIGPVEFWPAQVNLSDYAAGSDRFKQAATTLIQRQENPKMQRIDADRSAVAGLRLPELRRGQHGVSGEVWFPGSRLRETFPELASICQRFERWIRRFPIVFGKDDSKFAYQLSMCGFVRRAVALPEAMALLERGAFMVSHRQSPGAYAQFRRRLELSGHLPLTSK